MMKLKVQLPMVLEMDNQEAVHLQTIGQWEERRGT